jgi:hypothetical protein
MKNPALGRVAASARARTHAVVACAVTADPRNQRSQDASNRLKLGRTFMTRSGPLETKATLRNTKDN